MSTTQKPDPATLGGRETPDEPPAADPFAGMTDASGEPITDASADPDAQFRVVWIGPGSKTITVATSDDLDQAESIFAQAEAGKGRVFLFEAGDDTHPLDSKGEIEPLRTGEEQTEPQRTIDTEPPAPEDDELAEGEVAPEETLEEARARMAAEADAEVERAKGTDEPEGGELTVTMTAGGKTTGPIPASAIEDAAERIAGGEHLFEPGDFDDPALLLETPDGDRIDEIVVKLSGSLVLNRKDPLHVELFRELDRGRSVVVEARARITQESLDEKTKGEETIVSASRKLAVWRIESVRVAGRKILLSSTLRAGG